MVKPGPLNLITDVEGIKVGNTHNADIRTGVTVILPDNPVTAAVDIRGGGPGTRETALLDPQYTVEQIHALVLSGGSAFGLDAATGVQSWLREQGKGFNVGGAVIPIVPQAILFDMLNGGNKDWGRRPPFQDMAYDACTKAATDLAIGTIGAGFGATTVNYKGGLGSASLITDDNIQIGAIAAVNAAGSVTVGKSKHFWAAPFERDKEFGGHGSKDHTDPEDTYPSIKGAPGQNTTIAAIATNLKLTQSQLMRLSIMAQTGLTHAIYPAHTPLDGDLVFAIATGKKELKNEAADLARIGTWAANTLARAIARGVYEAKPFEDGTPGTYQDAFNTSRDITGR